MEFKQKNAIKQKISSQLFVFYDAIGGIGNPNLAKAFLQNFPQFDFALWGEGEISLVKLAFNLDNPAIVPHMA